MRNRRLLLTGSIAALCVAAIAYVAVERWRTSRPGYRLDKGVAAARNGDFDAAQQLLDRLEESGARDAAALLTAELHFQRGQYSLALKALNDIRDQGELRARGTELAGRCLMSLGERRQAEQAFHFLLSLNPKHVDAHRFLATIYYDQGDLSRTEGHLLEVAKLDPNDARPHRLIGLIHKDLEEADLAVDAYREALRRGLSASVAAEVRVELAECCLKQFQHEEALAVLDGLDSVEARIVRVEALVSLTRIDEATNLLDEALKASPDHPGLLRLRAERYLAKRRPKEAAALLEKVIAADASDFRSRFKLAQALDDLDRHAEAAKQHEQVKKTQAQINEMSELTRRAMRDPWDADTRRKLADLSEQLNRPELATMWRRAADASAAKPKDSNLPAIPK